MKVEGVGSLQGTYESEQIDSKSTNGMSQRAEPKNIKVPRRHDEVPEEVPCRECLHHAAGARVPPDSLLPPHGAALLIGEHDPERERVDERALDERDDVGVPVEAAAAREVVVDVRHEEAGDEGRERVVDYAVEEGGEEDLVDMEG